VLKADRDQVVPYVSGSPFSSRAQRRAEEAMRRKLARERMKFDKWVTPQGERPEKHERKPRAEPKPLPKIEVEMEEASPDELPPLPMSESEDGHYLIADHYDGDENNPLVLYEESELWGVFNFRDTLLEQLERYEFYIQRMARYDPEAYAFYKEYGAQLLPYMSTDMAGTMEMGAKLSTRQLIRYKKEIALAPMFNVSRPAFGCIAFGCNPKVEKFEKGCKWIVPRFIYYRKYSKPPPEVQLAPGGDIYAVTVWWDRADDKRTKWGVPTEFPIYISTDGKTIKALRTCETKWIPIKKKRCIGHFHIPDRHWRLPDDFAQWAAQHGLDVQSHLCHIFTQAVKDAEHSQFGDCRVQVRKGDTTAVFNIDSRRMAYFFKDRDYDNTQVTATGQRKRIFHIVSAYTTKKGTHVKMKYRGLRQFTWAGHHVTITVPGLDHYLQSEFNVGSIDERWTEDGKRYLTTIELAKRLTKDIATGKGGYK
jgi:hypothetical protein